MNEEEKKAAEEAEAKVKAEAEAKAAEEARLQEEKIDYKSVAEANEALALAEKARADAAEALIIKNKEIIRRQKDNDGNPETLTEDKVTEIVKNVLASNKVDEESPEAKALIEATKNLAIQKAKTAEVTRALQAKETSLKDTATTTFDGQKDEAPKLPENSPLKEFTYVGNGIYSQKLKSGKTMFKNTNAGPGQAKSWIE